MRIAANLTMLFREYDFFERFDRAAEAGFTGVEFFFPYAHDLDRIADAVDRNDLQLVLFNLPVGDWDAGERGYVAQTGREAEFRRDLGRAVTAIERLHPLRVNTPSGPAPQNADSHSTLVANLAVATAAVNEAGAGLVVEPINRDDVPGAYVHTVAEGVAVLDEVGSPGVGIQYDVYHSLRAGEDPFAVLEAYADRIHHVQISDVPGRHEPGTGTFDFDRFFDDLEASVYDGWVSLEYHPLDATTDSLRYFRERGLLDENRQRS